MSYEEEALQESRRWMKQMEKRSSLLQRTSKRMQKAVNERIPERVHAVVTDSIKRMVELSLTSSNYIYPIEVDPSWSLREKEEAVQERLTQYKRTAALEGAGTGAGGIMLGLADFPLLLSIKMKFLFDVGRIYGYDVRKYEERMYVLHIFLLAFSSDEKRQDVLQTVVNWEDNKEEVRDMDWKTLQLEYRDTIDFAKMLQLIPGLGAIVGAVANFRFLEKLGETATHAYRIRILDKEKPL